MAVILALFFAYAALLSTYSITAGKPPHSSWRLVWLLLAIVIFLLSATRIGGSDWDNYESLYQYMSHADGWLDAILKNPFFEPGYVALNYAFHTYSEDRRLLVVFESAINAYAIWAILTRVRSGPILLIWLFPLQFANILGVRQTLATSLFIIATTLLHGRTSKIAALASSLIHVSSLVLVFGKAIQGLKITLKNASIVLVPTLTFAYVASSFLADKLANYQENASELTSVSGTEIFIGKGLTVLLLFAIDFFARRQPLDRAAMLARTQTPNTLYFFYLVIIVASAALPPLARLLTPLELLIAWAACEAIYDVRNRRTRLAFTLLITVVAVFKMLKIASQFGDVYSVCFFCA